MKEDGDPGEEVSAALVASAVILQNLADAGNLERLESEARRFLEADPEDFHAHYYLVLGLTDEKRFKEARPHLDFLLRSEPESIETLYAAIHWEFAQGRWRQARVHIEEGLRVDPEMAFFHRFAAIDDARRMKLKEAKAHIARARELAPDDPEIANLYIRIHGALETSMDDALTRLHQYEEALALDPHNGEIHNSIGDVYLDELEDPVAAEQHYREAVLDDPQDRAYQRDLFNAVAKRSLIYRLFSIPSRTFTWLGHLFYAIRYQPWRLLLLLLAFKLVIVFFLWLAMVTVLFWPGGKVYEWLIVTELKRGAGASVGELRTWYWFRRWPVWLRFALFLGLNAGLWAGLFSLVGVSIATGFTFVGIVAGIHLGMVCLLWAIRRAKASLARRRRERKGATPPPLPGTQVP